MFARRNTLWIVVVLVAISLDSCRHDVPVRARRPAAEGAGTLVLLAEQVSSGACCRVATVNTGHASLRVVCHLAVFDAAGHLVYAGLVPGPQPGHRRSIGFLAPTGNEEQGMIRPADRSGARLISGDVSRSHVAWRPPI